MFGLGKLFKKILTQGEFQILTLSGAIKAFSTFHPVDRVTQILVSRRELRHVEVLLGPHIVYMMGL